MVIILGMGIVRILSILIMFINTLIDPTLHYLVQKIDMTWKDEKKIQNEKMWKGCGHFPTVENINNHKQHKMIYPWLSGQLTVSSNLRYLEVGDLCYASYRIQYRLSLRVVLPPHELSEYQNILIIFSMLKTFSNMDI